MGDLSLKNAITIDVHRMGSLDPGGSIRRGEQYIALSGSSAEPAAPEMRLSHRDFLQQLHKLRYPEGIAEQDVARALKVLGDQAAEILRDLPTPRPGDAVQIDLVLGAAELWAFPFEACSKGGVPAFADPNCARVLTRRIRQGFVAERRPWPVRPRILFLHAPPAADLCEELIDAHAAALEEALKPWSVGGRPREEGWLTVEMALGPASIEKAMSTARAGVDTEQTRRPFTHVHVLAHGKGITDPVTGEVRWGLRLGDTSREASDPAELAAPLSPKDGLPVIVSLAACDSANQANPMIPTRSFAQELHRAGIPVVLASQLPLTEDGSVTMARTFYRALLSGEDVRLALHETRLALHEDEGAGHDWVGLVGYVQLPEGYGDHLAEVGVQRDMERLKAARRRLDAALQAKAAPETTADEAFDEIEREVTSRIASLEGRCDSIPDDRVTVRSEAGGVLASAQKRLAELLHCRGERAADAARRDRYHEGSRRSLEAASERYRRAFHADLQNHWLGVQSVSLDAVLNGRIAEERVWDTALYAAELALSRREGEYWAYGTLAELWLLAPVLRKPEALDKAEEALDRLRAGAERAGDADAVPSTQDQLSRYVSWWTKENGFFGDRDDLAAAADGLLSHLTRAVRR